MNDYRKALLELCQQEGRPSREAVARVLADVDTSELLSFLTDTAADLLAIVEDIPNLILDGLEQDLATDDRSKQAAAAIIARLTAPGAPKDLP